MADLSSTIRGCFDDTIRVYNNSFCGLKKLDTICQMNIPVSNAVVDIPVFALGAFVNTMRLKENTEINSIIVTLDGYIQTSGYKSLDAIIKDIFSRDYCRNKLNKFISPGTPERVYYGIKGAIFDKDLNPILMFSWQLIDVNGTRYRFLKPILWVSPVVFTQKDDSLMRHIINKIIPITLNLNYLGTPGFYSIEGRYFDTTGSSYKPNIEIGKFPFTLEKPDAPSVSTTNEKLLKVALDNIDEVVLCP